MQYLLLIYQAEAGALRAADDETMATELAAYGAFTVETRERNQYLAGEALEPTSTATSVRIRDGHLAVTDGPQGVEKKQDFKAPAISDTRAGLSWVPTGPDSARLAWDVKFWRLSFQNSISSGSIRKKPKAKCSS